MRLPFAIIALCVGVCGATEYFVDKNRPDDSGAACRSRSAENLPQRT